MMLVVSVMLETSIDLTVIDLLLMTPPNDAVIETLPGDLVVMANVALFAPAGIVTLAGTLATLGDELTRVTSTGASVIADNVTVPFATCPCVSVEDDEML